MIKYFSEKRIPIFHLLCVNNRKTNIEIRYGEQRIRIWKMNRKEYAEYLVQCSHLDPNPSLCIGASYHNAEVSLHGSAYNGEGVGVLLFSLTLLNSWTNIEVSLTRKKHLLCDQINHEIYWNSLWKSTIECKLDSFFLSIKFFLESDLL